VPRGLRVGPERLELVLLMVALEDHIQEVVVLDVLDPVCVYIDPKFLLKQKRGQSILKTHRLVWKTHDVASVK